MLVRPQPNWTLISGVAGAIDSMTRGLALDLAPIRVNVISPGLVRTEVSRDKIQTIKIKMFNSPCYVCPT